MTVFQQNTLNIVTFNLHRLNQGRPYLVELLITCDIVCGQEHLLISPELHQLGKITNKFRTYSCSAMDDVISNRE